MEMKKYKFIKAEDYCRRVFDGTHDSPKPCKNGFKLLTSKNILSGELDKEDAYFISEEDYNAINQRSKVQQFDILFSMIGSVGNVCLIKDSEIDFAIKNMGVFSCEDESKAYYLYYYLQSPYAKKIIESYLNGAVQKFLGLERLRTFPVPEYSESKGLLAKVLSHLDRKIVLNRVINRNLEALAKQLYDYWFVQFDFPDENGRPYKLSGGKMVWNEALKREVPEGWKVKSVNDVSSICRGVSYKPNDLRESGVLILRGNNIENNHIVYDNNTAYLLPDMISDEQKIKKHDIIITMSSGSKEHIGKCAMFQRDSEHSFGAFLSKITPQEVCPYFLFLFLTSSYFKQKIKSICNGTGINNLTNQTFDEVKFAYPTKGVLLSFERSLQPIFDMIGINESEINTLTRKRDELLPLLMNGQVTIE